MRRAKKKQDARAERQEHDGDAGHNPPEGKERRTTFLPLADEDVAWHRDEQFEDASAEQPPRGASL